MCHTNITDKNGVHFTPWFEASLEYNKLLELKVPYTVIDTIEADVAAYVEEHDIDDFNDIPTAEIIAAIADNTDAQTRLHILWECKEAELDGTHYQADQFDTPSYTEPIGRDQAVDDDGEAIYDDYTLTVDVAAPDDCDSQYRDYDFSPADIEEFAHTW